LKYTEKPDFLEKSGFCNSQIQDGQSSTDFHKYTTGSSLNLKVFQILSRNLTGGVIAEAGT